MINEFVNLFPEIKLTIKTNCVLKEEQLLKQLDSKKMLYFNEFFEMIKNNNLDNFKKLKENFVYKVRNDIENCSLMKIFLDNKENIEKKNNEFEKEVNLGSFNRIKSYLVDNNIENTEKENTFNYYKVDIRKSNYNSIKMFYEMFSSEENIDEISIDILENDFDNFIIKRYSNEFDKNFIRLMLSSKIIRQVIFGKINSFPYLLDIFTNYLIFDLSKKLNVDLFDKDKVLMKSQDEIVFKLSKENTIEENELKSILKKEEKYFKLEMLEFEVIEEVKSFQKNPGRKFYIETNKETNHKELKTVPSDLYLYFFVTKIIKQDLRTEDLVFEKDGNIYKLILEGEK